MQEYDGFSTVREPIEYMNAPAMTANHQYSLSVGTDLSSMPSVLQAAIDFSQNFITLSADELQAYSLEQSNLERRLTSIKNRLEVEYKMREAAQSISKIHASEREHHSKSAKRLSRLLIPDSPTKNEKRLSKEALQSAAISDEKIKDLERTRIEVERKKSSVDRKIFQHHCAVMAKALTGKPLPNHQRNKSINSIVSSSSTSRLSWVMAPKHQRRWSQASVGDPSSLATVSEVPGQHSTDLITDAGMTASKGLPQKEIISSGASNYSIPQSLLRPNICNNDSVEEIMDELDQLVSKIEQVWPQQSPALNGKVSLITTAFDNMLRDLGECRNNLEATRIQLDHSKSRIDYLQEMLQKKEKDGVSSSNSLDCSNNNNKTLQCDASMAELKHQLENEKLMSQKWREQAEVQRNQLAKTTKSLEDVTKLAVQLESDRSTFEVTLEKLHQKITTLESEKLELLQKKLSSTKNTSLLCQEFHQIISDLVTKHDREIRSFYPKFSKNKSDLLSSMSLQADSSGNADSEISGNHSDKGPLSTERTSTFPSSDDNLGARSDAKHIGSKSTNETRVLDEMSLNMKDISTKSSDKSHLTLPNPGAYLPTPVDRSNSVLSTGNDSDNTAVDSGKLGQINTSTSDFKSSDAQHSPENLYLPKLSNSTAIDDSYSSSLDNSIQNTSESLMIPLKPEFSRHDTSISKESNSSSFYADLISPPGKYGITQRIPIGSNNESKDELL